MTNLELSNIAKALNVAIVEELGSTEAACRLFSIAFRIIHPQAEIWTGVIANLQHFWIRVGRHHYDGTSDQFGLPLVLGSTHHPAKVASRCLNFYRDVDYAETELSTRLLRRIK